MTEGFEVLGMVSKKDKRRSGYVTPVATVSRKELLENDLVIEPFYDDWKDYRDGMRDWFRDFKLIRENVWGRWWCQELADKRNRMNNKQKKLLQRRKARKSKLFFS